MILSFFILSLLIREPRKKYVWGLICAECIVICLSNFIRTESVFLGGVLLVVIVFIKVWKKGIRFWGHLYKSVLNWTLLVSIVLSYVGANVLDAGVATVVCKSENVFVPQNVRSQPWHSLYIGFSFEENPYGIIYKDECAMAKVQEIDSQVVCYSEEYDEI